MGVGGRQGEGAAALLARVVAPFGDEVRQFLEQHEVNFIVEQNRDAQLRTLLVQEYGLDPALIQPVLHYDGTPITARFIADAVAAQVRKLNVRPIQGGKAA